MSAAQIDSNICDFLSMENGFDIQMKPLHLDRDSWEFSPHIVDEFPPLLIVEEEESEDKSSHSTTSDDAGSDGELEEGDTQERQPTNLLQTSIDEHESDDDIFLEDDTAELQKQKKGLGGLSPEKKRLLKKLIMDRAMEELRKEEELKKVAKQQFMSETVDELPAVEDMGPDELKAYCEHIYEKLCGCEEDKYDWEVKLRKQDYEINELTIQVNDIRGKFVKPVLRKVSGAESKLAKLNELKASLAGMKKSTSSQGSQQALDENDNVDENGMEEED